MPIIMSSKNSLLCLCSWRMDRSEGDYRRFWHLIKDKWWWTIDFDSKTFTLDSDLFLHHGLLDFRPQSKVWDYITEHSTFSLTLLYNISQNTRQLTSLRYASRNTRHISNKQPFWYCHKTRIPINSRTL